MQDIMQLSTLTEKSRKSVLLPGRKGGGHIYPGLPRVGKISVLVFADVRPHATHPCSEMSGHGSPPRKNLLLTENDFGTACLLVGQRK